MFQVVMKLKALKKPFRKLLFSHGNIHQNVISLRDELDRVQKDLDSDPFNDVLREEEAAYVNAYNEAVIKEERFLKQKAKVEWLRVGDSNSAFFHKTVKSRNSKSRIESVVDSMGNVLESNQVAAGFVSHYEQFLGQTGATEDFSVEGLFTKRLDDATAVHMIRPVSQQEVKDVIFSMGNDKAPGPDGYSAAFFKESWVIIAEDVTRAIQEFFRNGKLLKELNHTIIALIPKIASPTRITDFRPISCCNVIFKCVTKIISNRIKNSLDSLVSINQSAFVPGRRIADNILLTQELMYNYHLDRGIPRCAFKVDIQKAYDTVDWAFLERILQEFGFHQRMIHWIMECVTSTSFSICLNGSLHGYFQGKRGLRQGDPLSPYLFTLVMEVLTLMFTRNIKNSTSFSFHPKCAELELVNLCFADDLFIFARGDTTSAKLIMDTLEEFKIASGLVPSIPKSTGFFCNVLNHTKIEILRILPFEEGKLPIKYLGVPLVSAGLHYNECRGLVEKIQNRIDNWTNKFLSFAGRVQLIRSVLSSMHVYWSSVFLLPARVIRDIEKLLRGFLWCKGPMLRGKAKVSWDVVCRPKQEGGLGIRRLDLFNKALLTTHIWNLISDKESLWVKWINTYKLSKRNFWEVHCRGRMACGWKKILLLRPLVRTFFIHTIGNGETTSAWFDSWNSFGHLANFVSIRDIYRADFDLSTKVRDVVSNNAWKWPQAWLLKYPLIAHINIPNFSDSKDKVEWLDENGVRSAFSVAAVWRGIRPRFESVDWYDIVWFPKNVPRFSFILWLVILGKLKTQDMLRSWDRNGSVLLSCSLCNGPLDSHLHLFFGCTFSNQVWLNIRSATGLLQVCGDYNEIIRSIIPFAKRRTCKSVIAKLVFSASVYYIWQERNNRLFGGKKRSVAQVVEVIRTSVRYKLLSCSFKKSREGVYFAGVWQLSESVFY